MLVLLFLRYACNQFCLVLDEASLIIPVKHRIERGKIHMEAMEILS